MAFSYSTSECVPRLYPISTFLGNLIFEGNEHDPLMISRGNYKRAQWGDATSPVIIDNNTYPFPSSINMLWIALTEVKLYWLDASIDSKKIEKHWVEKDQDGNALYEFVVVGAAPYGQVAIWLRGHYKSVLIHWLQGREVDERNLGNRIGKCSMQQYCQLCVDNDEVVKQNLIENGLPPTNLFDHWMEQMEYRYVPLEEYWDGETWQEYDEDDMFYDDIMLNELHVQRYDGTHQQLPDDISLLKYHQAGMPKRLALRWDEGRSHLSAYWWMDDQVIYPILHRFFNFDPGERADLLLRCDSRHHRFEMALKGGEMQRQPVNIPQEAYQIIVFKDGHELYKSPNFAQEDGAWNW